jgi:hypothetical protein
LGIKLTAAFGLVVPFAWLCQRSFRRAMVWGVLTVGITIALSFLLPGWSWSTMLEANWLPGIQALRGYRMQPDAYTAAWVPCLLALFALANRYIRNEISPITPWLWAAGAALIIHLAHQPYFTYYNLHLIAPLAVMGGIGLIDLYRILRSSLAAMRVNYIEFGAAIATSVVLCALWFWHEAGNLRGFYLASLPIAKTEIVADLKALKKDHQTAYSADPYWTFMAGMSQTPPELTITSLKRGWSSQITDKMITQLLASNHVGGIIVYKSYLQNRYWSNFLSGYSATARSGETALFVRKDLKPKPIDLNDERRMYSRLGLRASK